MNIKVTNFDGVVLFDGPSEDYFIPSDDKIKRTWIIYVKGYYQHTRFDAHLEKSFADVVYGNGFFIFPGTEKECDDFELTLIHKNIKIIGTKIYNPKPKNNGTNHG